MEDYSKNGNKREEKGSSMSKLSWVTETIKKHKKLTIVLVVILIVAVGGVAVAGNMNKRKEQIEALMNQTQTSQVERRTLVSSVSATGTLTSVNSKEVVVNLSGVEVECVSVQLGDIVEEGQILCEFDSEDIEENLAEAKTALDVANQKTQMDLTAAERNLADAREDYDTDLKRGNTDLGVAYNDYVLALEDVEEAESAFNEAKATTIEKKSEYEYRQGLLNQKKAELDAAGGSSEANVAKFTDVRNALIVYAESTDGVSMPDKDKTAEKIGLGNDLSLVTYGADATSDFVTNNPDAIKDYINQLEQYQAAYNTSRQLEQEYAALQQEVSSWQTKYNTAVQNESSAEKAYEQALSASQSELSAYQKQQRTLDDTTKSAENNVINKTESLTTAQLNALSSGNSEEDKVEQYQQQLDDCIVEAPISGVISAVNIEVGDTYNGTAIVTIDDVSAFEVTAEIDEYDIGKIEKGQKVVIKTNATGDEELEGTVKIVSPKASAGGSEVTYTVIISVDTPNEMLRMDMTAKLSIILESKENVLTVPYEAVQEEESGKFYVEVVDNTEGSGQTSEKTETNAVNTQKDTAMISEKIETNDAEPQKDTTVSGNSQQKTEGIEAGEMPQIPEGMEAGEKSQLQEGMSEGNRPQGMNSGKNQKMPGGSSSDSDVATRRIYIEKGVESDYYIEIISDEITEGMEVVVPKTSDENSGNIQMMMMRQGPMGGF